MDKYQEAIRRAVHRLPFGCKRLRADQVKAIAQEFGKTTKDVWQDVEDLAKRRNSGEGY